MSDSVAKSRGNMLPVEREGRSSARRLATTIAWTLFFVLAANAGTIVALRHLPANLGYWLVKQKWRMLEDLDRPVDWLVLGDSSVNQGLDCRLFDEIVDGTSVNLGTTAVMTMVNDAWMLESYIEKHGPPRGVLIVHVYQMWQESARAVGIGEIPRPWGFWNQAQPPVAISSNDEWLVFLQRFAPLYAKHASIAEMLKHPLRTLRWRASVDARGFMSCEDYLPARIESERQAHLEFVRRSYELSSDNRRALERIVELAEKHQFDVYLANSPILNDLSKDLVFSQFFRRTHQDIERIVGHSP
ncbi:MAG: hypothetical protein U1D30_22505, partial [Planctomycetota bacterium]